MGAVFCRHHYAPRQERCSSDPCGEDRQGIGGDHDQHGSACADAAAAGTELGTTATGAGQVDGPLTESFGTDLKDISLKLKGEEIRGIAGIAGNGQSELMDALSGEIAAGRPESIMIDGVPAGHMGPHERRRIHGCFVPEERNGHAAVTTMTLAENAFLSAFIRRALVRFGVINKKKTSAFAEHIIKAFDVRTTGPKAEARSLSGGNLQKFLVGREVLQDPAVLVINQPT